jgi:hypothetical protein
LLWQANIGLPKSAIESQNFHPKSLVLKPIAVLGRLEK